MSQGLVWEDDWLALYQFVINASYQKLPFGSGDYPDKLLFH